MFHLFLISPSSSLNVWEKLHTSHNSKVSQKKQNCQKDQFSTWQWVTIYVDISSLFQTSSEKHGTYFSPLAKS